MGIDAGVLNGPVVALFRVFLVFFVDSVGAVSVGEAIVCEVDLQIHQDHYKAVSLTQTAGNRPFTIFI